MDEEFQESEVIFQETDGIEVNGDGYRFPNSLEWRKTSKPKRKKMRSTKKDTSSSVPVNIPARISWFQRQDSEVFDGDDGNDEGEMEPPHVIIGRRIAGKMMAFSVCTGNGRTLKGRDLSEVRNSILRMTGFLET